MNKKQIITLWIVGLWCSYQIIDGSSRYLNHGPRRYFYIVDCLDGILPALIIGALFFLSFKEGLFKRRPELETVPNKMGKKKLLASMLLFSLLGIGLGILGTNIYFNIKYDISIFDEWIGRSDKPSLWRDIENSSFWKEASEDKKNEIRKKWLSDVYKYNPHLTESQKSLLRKYVYEYDSIKKKKEALMEKLNNLAELPDPTFE